MLKKRFLFTSYFALYPPLLKVAEIICQEYGLDGHVLAPDEFDDFFVHHPSGKFSAQDFDISSTFLSMHFLPLTSDHCGPLGFAPSLMKDLLSKISPEYIWIHNEFSQGLTLQMLRHYRFRPGPRIVAFVAMNHASGPQPLFYRRWPLVSRTRIKQLLLWPRLDGVAAAATKSLECARRLGLPQKVPVVVNYLPVFGPEQAAAEGCPLPWSRQDSFIVGFAGALIELKGWQVLLEALVRLPQKYKAVIAGGGPQKGELLEWLKRPPLQGRVHYTGVLPQPTLLATYPFLDVLVLPSITTSVYVEQFGAVLAEAMAAGVPVIGSNSGAIPETVGSAGLIVPEGNPQALAQAIKRLSENKELRSQLASSGLARFRQHYSCSAYAASIAKLLQIRQTGHV